MIENYGPLQADIHSVKNKMSARAAVLRISGFATPSLRFRCVSVKGYASLRRMEQFEEELKLRL
jgi:hypothetical protein